MLDEYASSPASVIGALLRLPVRVGELAVAVDDARDPTITAVSGVITPSCSAAPMTIALCVEPGSTTRPLDVSIRFPDRAGGAAAS